MLFLMILEVLLCCFEGVVRAMTSKKRRKKTRRQQQHDNQTTTYRHDEDYIQRTVTKMKDWQMEHPQEQVCVLDWVHTEGVAYQRLLSRWKGTRNSGYERQKTHSRLTPHQTQALLRYIKIRDQTSLPLPLKMVRHAADAMILRELSEVEHWSFQPVSDSWTTEALQSETCHVPQNFPLRAKVTL